MNLYSAKIVALFIFLFVKLFSGLSPFLLNKYLKKRSSKNLLQRFMCAALCLGGGILLSTVFIHMIPEVRESFIISQNQGYLKYIDSEYPLAELVVCVGFFTIYILECVAHLLFGAHYGHSHSSIATPEFSEKLNQKQINKTEASNNCSAESRNNRNVSCLYTSSNTTLSMSSDLKEHKNNVVARHFEHEGEEDMCKVQVWCGSVPPACCEEDLECRGTLDVRDIGNSATMLISLRNFMLVLAISFHSVFEGMAIGLQLTLIDMWRLFVAILIHAIAIMFCMGTEMLMAKIGKFKAFVYLTVMSTVTPLGIIVGIIVTEDPKPLGSHMLTVGILQGLAGGTLLYITFFEILDKEKLAKVKLNGLFGCMLVVIGFGIMTTMESMGSHSHGPSSSHIGTGTNSHSHHHHMRSKPLGFHDHSSNYSHHHPLTSLSDINLNRYANDTTTTIISTFHSVKNHSSISDLDRENRDNSTIHQHENLSGHRFDDHGKHIHHHNHSTGVDHYIEKKHS